MRHTLFQAVDDLFAIALSDVYNNLSIMHA